jgi:hypothetical protein
MALDSDSTPGGSEKKAEGLKAIVSSEPRSGLWGEWTEHQVKVATLLWIEKIVIGMKLCPFAVEAMNGLRVHVSNATNRQTALDRVDVEIKWIAGLDKSRPACTLMVYPPALFEKGGGGIQGSSPLCALDDEKDKDKDRKKKDKAEKKDYTPEGNKAEKKTLASSKANSKASSRESALDVDCIGFDGFMSLALNAREMAQDFNAAHGQDVDTETLLLTFHPTSTFSDVTDDPADFALRSPFPTILILRGTDVREAEDLCDIQVFLPPFLPPPPPSLSEAEAEDFCDIQGRVTEDIAIANEARLRTVGYV